MTATAVRWIRTGNTCDTDQAACESEAIDPMKKVLYVYGDRPYHPSKAEGELLSKLLAADGRFTLELTPDLDAFARLPQSDYAAVVITTTGYRDDLTGERETGLLKFVGSGGGLVGVHSAADSFRGSRPYVEILGAEFAPPPRMAPLQSRHRRPRALYHNSPAGFHHRRRAVPTTGPRPRPGQAAGQTPWQGQLMPMAYVRNTVRDGWPIWPTATTSAPGASRPSRRC